MTTTSATAPVTEIILTPKNPLKIMLTPSNCMRRSTWWVEDRQGLLSLRPDGLVVWHSLDFIATEPYGRAMADINAGFKTFFKEGWNILLAYTDSAWGELSFDTCDYSKESVIIPTYPSTFKLGAN
jgi:hypothetical protein